MSPSKSSPTIATEAGADRLLLGLPGVGPKTAERLAAAGLLRLEDLLLFAPRRYDDAGELRRVSAIAPGERAYVEGRVVRASVRRFFRRATLEVAIEDPAGGSLLLRWFRFRGAVPPRYAVGNEVRAAGLVRRGKRGLELIQPLVEALGADRAAAALRPRYRRIAGVPGLLVERLAACAQRAVQADPLGVPTSLPSLVEAARVLHALPPLPVDEARDALLQGRSLAHQRLAFEELLLLRLAARKAGDAGRAVPLAAADRVSEALLPLYSALRFSPTAAQLRVIAELAPELASSLPMRRLLTGDVGSGKTLVAAAAIELCCASGRRAVLLAPTALLAEQQAVALGAMLVPTGRRVALLHAGTPRRERARIEADLADPAGELDVVVGTHALLDTSLRLARLSLVVVDEQQRFGVLQRAALVERVRATGETPHQLSLSATPIPRTLALALRGAIDVSHLDAGPSGRAPIATRLLDGEDALGIALHELREELRLGGQAYWICPTIEDDGDSRGVLAAAAWVAEGLGRAVHLCHGQQSPRERARQLAAFRDEGGVLVATTVVEVGLDVPAATLVIVEAAERLGLSQLHQLRGRVGRGERAGRCLLCSPGLHVDAMGPLSLLVRVQDGLAIAEADLARRGMGELAGVEQSGLPSLPPLPAEVLLPLAAAADRAAEEILLLDPELEEPRHARLGRALARRAASEANAGA